MITVKNVIVHLTHMIDHVFRLAVCHLSLRSVALPDVCLMLWAGTPGSLAAPGLLGLLPRLLRLTCPRPSLGWVPYWASVL
jgi:hypothetical protein